MLLLPPPLLLLPTATPSTATVATASASAAAAASPKLRIPSLFRLQALGVRLAFGAWLEVACVSEVWGLGLSSSWGSKLQAGVICGILPRTPK